MEILMNYSGIAAIIVYSAILYLILKFAKKKGPAVQEEETVKEEVTRERLDPEDEYATIACLVAAIDCREECHRNVEIISVRRIA